MAARSCSLTALARLASALSISSLGNADRCNRCVNLRIDFAAVDGGDDLALGDAIPDVDEDAIQAAGQLGLESHACPRGERAGNFQRRFDRSERCADDRDVDDGGLGGRVRRLG